jgi:mycothiol synthase
VSTLRPVTVPSDSTPRTDPTPIPGPDRIESSAELTDSQRADVSSVLGAATVADAVAPISEHVMLRLSAAAGDAGRSRHLLQWAGTELVGYAHVEQAPADDVDPRFAGRPILDAELVVRPDRRNVGHGRTLLGACAEPAEPAGTGEPAAAAPHLVRIWSHGDNPAARSLASSLDYLVIRTLLQLRRPLGRPAEIEEPAFPDDVTLRSFRPGADDGEWLSLNARAFAHHPEQGRTTQADLQARMDEPWFDPEGFLIAEKDGAMIGFHWTKVHPEGLGEVYVVGVDPDRHGGGLGRALTLAGLRHLSGRGLETVLLYVESDNAPALAVYRRLGFEPWNTDVMYAGPQI